MTLDGHSIAHAGFEIGNSIIMLADKFPDMNCFSPLSIGGSPVGYFCIKITEMKHVAKNLQMVQRFQIQSKKLILRRQGYNIEDPFGYGWIIATHIKDLIIEEITKAAQQAFTTMSKSRRAYPKILSHAFLNIKTN